MGERPLLVLVTRILVLNLLTFLTVNSHTSNIDSGCCSNYPLQKDFLGVYFGARRLSHNPASVYVQGNVSVGEPPIRGKTVKGDILMSLLRHLLVDEAC